jgi:hypothetical protein
MTITQTVEIPADRRIILDVPPEVPTGRTILTFTPASSQKAYPVSAEKADDPNRKPISQFFGILSPDTYGDGVAYQRKLRNSCC